MKTTSKTIYAADLFCGAGGTSTGLIQACIEAGYRVNLVAVNHWDIAIKTHSRNHGDVTQICGKLEDIEPRTAVPGGHLDLLCASPECVHHSNARGGRPMSDQSRSSCWHIVEWAEALDIDHILMENVREFESYGPLDGNGRPIKERKGEYFQEFVCALHGLGYAVQWRLLVASHYGDATTRKRLFLQASKRGRITWPTPTHGTDRRPLRTAREIIDWSVPGRDIYDREKPLAPNSMKRILAGLAKFSGLPFLVKHYQGSDAASLDNPLPTITANYEHLALCEPYLVVFRNNCDARSLDLPVPGLTTSDGHFGIAQPFLVELAHTQRDDAQSCKSVDEPLPTIVTKPLVGLVEPYLVEYHGGPDGDARSRSVNEPLPTADTSNRFAVCTPFLVQYNGGSDCVSADKPVPTITTKARFGLVEPEVMKRGKVYELRIRYRMLLDRELAGAMSFPAGYHFEGVQKDRIRQIGNAVPVRTAQALCAAILSGVRS